MTFDMFFDKLPEIIGASSMTIFEVQPHIDKNILVVTEPSIDNLCYFKNIVSDRVGMKNH